MSKPGGDPCMGLLLSRGSAVQRMFLSFVSYFVRSESPFLRSLIAATNASAFFLAFLFRRLSFVRPRRQAFFRPDRRFRTPARAEAVKAGRRSAVKAYSDVSRPRLDSLEHGGRLEITGRKSCLGCRVWFLCFFARVD